MHANYIKHLQYLFSCNFVEKKIKLQLCLIFISNLMYVYCIVLPIALVLTQRTS